MVPGAIEDDLAVPGGGNRDRSIERSFEGQRHRAIERRHLRVDVVEPLRPIQADVHENDVSWLRATLPHDAPVAEPGAVVGLEQAGEAGFLTWPLIVGRIHVEGAALRRALRLGSGSHPHELTRLAGRAVGVLQLEPALVLGPGPQVQDAAGEAVGDDVVEVFALSEHALTANAHERQRLAPGGVADGPELDVDGRVAILVAANRPLEPKVQQRGVFDDEFSGLGAVLRGRGGRGQHEADDEP